MRIKDLLKTTRTISCEFFPPKTEDGTTGVFRAIERLKAFRPDFVSVTYGAGGSTRAFTEEITMRIKAEAALEVMAHLTCVAQTKEAVHGVLQRLENAGIENVIALRGDQPQGQVEPVPVEDGFRHATDLIGHIREHFQLGVAAAITKKSRGRQYVRPKPNRFTNTSVVGVDAQCLHLITQGMPADPKTLRSLVQAPLRLLQGLDDL